MRERVQRLQAEAHAVRPEYDSGVSRKVRSFAQTVECTFADPQCRRRGDSVDQDRGNRRARGSVWCPARAQGRTAIADRLRARRRHHMSLLPRPTRRSRATSRSGGCNRHASILSALRPGSQTLRRQRRVVCAPPFTGGLHRVRKTTGRRRGLCARTSTQAHTQALTGTLRHCDRSEIALSGCSPARAIVAATGATVSAAPEIRLRGCTACTNTSVRGKIAKLFPAQCE